MCLPHLFLHYTFLQLGLVRWMPEWMWMVGSRMLATTA